MSAFDNATAVSPAGEHHWTTPLDPGWFGSISPHGGHVAAQLLRAAMLEVGDPAFLPRTLTVHFTSRGKAGELELETRLERRGRTLQTVTVRGTQGERLIAFAVAGLALDRPGPELRDAIMPEVPSPDDVPGPWPRIRRETSQLADRYELRSCIGSREADRAEAGGWVRLREDRPPDDLLVAALTDIWMPAVMNRLPERLPCTTVELTINFMARPDDSPVASPWFLCVFNTPICESGYFREEGQVWAADGRLLALSSQLAVFTHSQ